MITSAPARYNAAAPDVLEKVRLYTIYATVDHPDPPAVGTS